MTILTLYLYGRIIFFKVKIRFIYLTIALSIIAILLTGIKTSALSLIFGFILIIYFKNRRIGTIVMVSIALVLLIYNTSISLIGMNYLNTDVTFDTPIQRIMSSFYIFGGIRNIADGSTTLVRSYNLFDTIMENPIFGVLRYYQGGYYKGIQSITDAFLFFNIAEFGLIGLTLILLPYIQVLRFIKLHATKSYKIMLTLFFVLLIQTITDPGIFYLYGNAVFFLLCSVSVVNIWDPYKTFNNSLNVIYD